MGMGNTGKHGIVDYLSLTTKGIVTCYEIKVTKEDLVKFIKILKNIENKNINSEDALERQEIQFFVVLRS